MGILVRRLLIWWLGLIILLMTFERLMSLIIKKFFPINRLGSPPIWVVLRSTMMLLSSCALEKQVCASLSEDYKSIDIAAKSTPVLGCSSVEMLEAQACLEGLQLAIDVGISGVILESDAARVIHLLSDHIISRTEVGAIIRNSLALGASVNLLSTEAVRRGANSVAHSLA
ncbi:hypothetical protein LWI28_025701 [Acer negundo]|uniref:RNase H type-1 domain-containing protein n=1 Tax=Acer negundo TaxID=4023 RepID=A0AAD5JH54_ACENE|nr:hypothetical protein LWI28_025701 [Acer negundo]